MAQNGLALISAAPELQAESMLRQLQALGLWLSVPLLAAKLRLCIAHTCHEGDVARASRSAFQTSTGRDAADWQADCTIRAY